MELNKTPIYLPATVHGRAMASPAARNDAEGLETAFKALKADPLLQPLRKRPVFSILVQHAIGLRKRPSLFASPPDSEQEGPAKKRMRRGAAIALRSSSCTTQQQPKPSSSPRPSTTSTSSGPMPEFS